MANREGKKIGRGKIMTKIEVILLASLSFSLGLIIGFFTSPIKNGITNIAGNTTNNYNLTDSKKEDKGFNQG